jgi:hypothetical protein
VNDNCRPEVVQLVAFAEGAEEATVGEARDEGRALCSNALVRAGK